MVNLPQFRVRWKDVTRISRDVVTGMTEEEAAATTRTARPMLVYVYPVDDADARIAIEEDKVFLDDKVATGARFFDCLRIDSEAAASDRAVADSVARVPALLLVRPNFEVSAVLRGRLSANRVFSAMCAAMQKDYENCVRTTVKKQASIMKERVALDREREKLAQLEEKVAETASTSKRAKLVRQRDELDKEISEREFELSEKEGALYVLEAKEPQG